MTQIIKGRWGFDGDTAVQLTMPLCKVDAEKRIVSGFATLDNVDTQDDVVTPEASMKAFARARGNIREQHDEKKAVGKMVSFKEGEFYDPESRNMYRGVYVDVYVSKGAQDTWEKVLDGTLSGFSIGGKINKATNEIAKSGKSVRKIVDYDLTELSLVDNPANQLASVLSIQKSANGTVTLDGPATEIKGETVFYCEADGNVQCSDEDKVLCLKCGIPMEDIGWFEVQEDRLEKVREIVDTFIKSNEGGVTTTVGIKDTFTKAKETEPEVQPEVVPETPEVEPEPVVEETPAEVVTEVVDEEEAILSKINDLKEAIQDSLESNKKETTEVVKSLEEKFDELNKSFEKKTSEIDSKLSDFSERLNVAKSNIAEFQKALDVLDGKITKVNSSVAIKKSADVVSEETTEKTSKWNGAFSVDNLVR